MSYKSGFFDAVDLGGGNYDRVYAAADFAHYWSLLVGNGVFMNPANTLQVMAMDSPNMDISISSGTGWINGYYFTIENEDSETLSLSVASATLPRIDSIVIGWNQSDRQITPYVKTGTPSTDPSPVELQRDKEVYELELAQISIPAGLGAITQEQIKDMRQDSTRCGIVSGLIDQFDATGLFAQYEALFNNWFENIKSQLSGDVAANLQNQIDEVRSYAESKPIISTGTARAEDWTGDTPSRNVVSIPGATTGDACDILVGLNYDTATEEQREAEREAMISPAEQGDGTVTLIAEGAKPTQDLPIIAFIFVK